MTKGSKAAGSGQRGKNRAKTGKAKAKAQQEVPEPSVLGRPRTRSTSRARTHESGGESASDARSAFQTPAQRGRSTSPDDSDAASSVSSLGAAPQAGAEGSHEQFEHNSRPGDVEAVILTWATEVD
jgi:hypothetical protein